MDIDIKWRKQRNRRVGSIPWILLIMTIGIILLLLVSSFGSRPVRSQSIADIDHVVLFMQVRSFVHNHLRALLISFRKIGPLIM
jgi:hypothetical protein